MFHLGGSTKPFKLPPGYMHSRVMIITKIMLLVNFYEIHRIADEERDE